MSAAHRYDVIIAGGGMVGASLALALSGLGLDIAVLEAVPLEASDQPSYDARATAVSLGSQRIFSTLEVWPEVSADATPIEQIHISDRGNFGFTRIGAREQGVEALGYVVENRCLGAALWERLAGLSDVSVLCPARLERVAASQAGVRVEIAKPDHLVLQGRLLVAADGARSSVRELLNIAATAWDYRQNAIVANVSAEEFHDHIAYERFTSNGPLAFLPMSDGRCNVVWSIDSTRTDEIMALSERDFLTLLQAEFGFRLGALKKVGARHSYPLSLVKSTQSGAERVVFVGNAARSLHPIAGQGFNLGLRDVAALGEAIADGARQGEDPGSPAVLESYAAWRSDDQRRAILFTDGLVRLFTNPLGPVMLARNLGLLSLDIFPPAKRALAKHSMGVWGKQPRLARGVPLA